MQNKCKLHKSLRIVIECGSNPYVMVSGLNAKMEGMQNCANSKLEGIYRWLAGQKSIGHISISWKNTNWFVVRFLQVTGK